MKLAAPYVHVLFGARQVGKTLLRGFLPRETTVIDLAEPRELLRYLSDPGLLVRVCQALPRRPRTLWQLGAEGAHDWCKPATGTQLLVSAFPADPG